MMASKKGASPAILIIVLLLMIVVLGGVGLAWKTEYLDKWLPPAVKEMLGKVEEEAGEEAEGKPEEKPKPSELVSLDKTWNKHINYPLEFSMKVPKKFMHSYGACKWDGSSYRPKMDWVPTKVFEDIENGIKYITSEYYYELTGETVEDGIHYYSKCNKVTNTLTRIKDEYLSDDRGHYQQAWKIFVKDVENDAELEEFIKARYGWGCGLGEKKPTTQEGIYDVGVKAPEAESLEEAEEKGCLINYMTVLKYFPAKNKAISWDLGQAYTFYKSQTGYDNAYDDEMVESFKFLE